MCARIKSFRSKSFRRQKRKMMGYIWCGPRIASLWEKMVASFHCNMSKVHILASAPLFFFASRYSPFLVHTYTYTYSYYTFNLSRKTLLISKYRVARKLPTSSPSTSLPFYPKSLCGFSWHSFRFLWLILLALEQTANIHTNTYTWH